MAANAQTAPINSRRPHSFKLRLNSPLRTAVLALLVAGGSYFAAMLGHAIVLSSQGVSVLWPACAFLVSVMLLVPCATWPILIPAGLAGFVVHDLQFGFRPWTIAWLILADTIEILIVCLGLKYTFDGVPRLDTSKALAKYCLFAVFLGPFASAFVVAMAVSGSYVVNWRIWFFSQTLAFLTVTPAILSWADAFHGHGFRGSLKSKVEAAALIGGLAIFGYFVLVHPWKTLDSALIYSFVPFLVWAALRFGSMGVSTSMIVISLLSIWGAIHGHGPFAGPEAYQDVLSLQLFLMFAAIPFMVLAALAEERELDQRALSNVNRKLIAAQEQERTRIARELHDDINQRIAVLAVDLDRFRLNLPESNNESHGYLQGLRQRLLELGVEVQTISHRLHSSKLEYLGLVVACKSFCKEVSGRHKVEVDFTAEDIPRGVSQDVSLCLFRVLQEGVTNAIKYSGVQRFEVRLRKVSDELRLTIRDRGAGFDVDRALSGEGLGLISMRERAHLVKGTVSITSTPIDGTEINVHVPLLLPEETSAATFGAA